MPYASKAQQGYFNVHRNELEKQGVNVDEWNKASKGLKLPAHKKPRQLFSKKKVREESPRHEAQESPAEERKEHRVRKLFEKK